MTPDRGGQAQNIDRKQEKCDKNDRLRKVGFDGAFRQVAKEWELREAAAAAQAGEGRRRHRGNRVRAGRGHRRWPAPPARGKRVTLYLPGLRWRGWRLLRMTGRRSDQANGERAKERGARRHGPRRDFLQRTLRPGVKMKNGAIRNLPIDSSISPCRDDRAGRKATRRRAEYDPTRRTRASALSRHVGRLNLRCGVFSA